MIATRSHSRSASSIEVRREEHRLAAVADAADQVPDRAARLRVEPGGQLVEEHDLRIVDERQRDEQPLLLAARERHEPARLRFSVRPSWSSSSSPFDRARVERRPEIDGLPHLDALLQLRFLQLDADAVLERVRVLARVEPQDRDGAAVGLAEALDALHRRGLARAVRADQPEDLALEHVERHVVDRDGRAVGFAQMGNLDDGFRGHRIPQCECVDR